MPVFTRLWWRLLVDPKRGRRYLSNLGRSRKTAKNVPLVHVTRAASFADLVLSRQPLHISKAGSAGRTLDDEDAIGLGRCLYFCAGRAYHKPGGAALAFRPAVEDRHTGDATPFDTGGMIEGLIFLVGKKSREKRVEFIKKSLIALRRWRRYFAHYLAADFDPIRDYIEGRPRFPDPESVFTDDRNDFRAWTFEVRFHEAQELSPGCLLKWHGSPGQRYAFEREMRLAAPEDVPLLSTFYDLMLDGEAKVDYFGDFDKWIAKEYF